MISDAVAPGIIAAVVLAIERIAYAFVWHQPDTFRAMARAARIPDSVDLLVRLFVLFKALQISVCAAWCLYFGTRAGWPELTGANVLMGLLLAIVGQILNASVFIRLGRIGVFYGARLGHRVPWTEGFPFSLVRHPQYVGTVMTLWGTFLALRFPYDDWIVIPLIETVYYITGSAIESAPELSSDRLTHSRQESAT